jgi:ribose transport system substrate-binding protein
MAKKLGFKVIEYKNQGGRAEYVAGMNYAMSIGADIIDLSTGTDPRLLGPQIKQAQAKGIKVIETHETGLTQGKSPYVDLTMAAPYEKAGKLMADWAVVDSGGDVTGLIITSEEVRGAPSQVNAIKDELERVCPDTCEVTMANAPVAKWSTTVGPAVTGALLKNPRINYIFPLYDPETPFVVAALATARKTDEVKIVTYAGTPSALEYVQKGQAAMDVGENLSWIGLAIIDDYARMLEGKGVLDEKIALRVFDETNVDETGTPPELSKGYGTAVSDGYCKLWGLPERDCAL